MDPQPRRHVGAGLVALAALAVLTLVSLWTVLPPSPRASDAPAEDFSADRAFSHVEQIGAKPHVVGSPAADGVRAYIETTLRGLGVRFEEQDAVGATDELSGGYGMARVRNVIAVLPGTQSTGRVFLMAHYDSVQVSYGANDDGAGVSTLLETARALAAGPAPRNDVVLVFTDGEEACLCGAEAFVNQHPLAADGGVVINVEARGSNGPSILFETSVGNAGIVGVYGSAVPYPVGTSFAVEVYRLLPNDTDLTPFLQADRFVGLNTSYIDGVAAYHSPQDNPSFMDKASLQHHGSNTLALARAFGNEDLKQIAQPSAGDSTYFPALGLLVRYPGWLVWPFAGLALLAVVALGFVARRRSLASWPRITGGFVLTLIPLLIAPVAAQLLWTLLVLVRPGYGNMSDPWRPGWYRIAVIALVAAVLFGWYGLLRRRLGAWSLAIAALGWLAVLGLVIAAEAPGGSYLAALPALAGAVGAIVAAVVRKPWLRLVAVAVGGAVAVIVLAPTVLLFFPALGLEAGGVAALFAVMLGFALLPVLEWVFPERGPRVSLVGATAGALVIVCAAAGLAVDRFDSRYPLPTQLAYALDLDTNQALWVTKDAAPADWTKGFLNGGTMLADRFPMLGEGDQTGPAPVAQLPAPTATVVSDSASGGGRVLTLSVKPQRDVRLIYLQINAKVIAATVAGRPVDLTRVTDPDTPGLRLLFHAPPAAGLSVSLTLPSTGPVAVRVVDGSDGLTNLPGFRPRPADVGISGSHSSELVLVAKTYTL